MADPNAFPNKEKEDFNSKIDKKIDSILNRIDFDSINVRIDRKLKKVEDTLSQIPGLQKTDLLSSEDRKYVNTLPEDYKNKALRYLDIFRENPEVVSEYLTTLKQFGSEKEAKKSGTDNILFYPNKILAHISKDPEKFSEETIKRQTAFDLQGGSIYDIAYREDKIGKDKQKEYYGKYSTKILGGISEAGYNTMRTIADIVAKVTDAVGPENATSAVE